MNKDKFQVLLVGLINNARQELPIEDVYSVLQIQNLIVETLLKFEIEKLHKSKLASE